ncbi:hypothetical protein Cob_v009176 [Colletotrichum orbiculare MAFF 240422]|uniref:Uncharacterized protein n=2 Tax=Colletotrichum orbiculare species complex TaxID=2707354 RepID=N4VUP0_COLOR|nr:hypothetical protein Cob_v009176 [Colletotrichum orbiculare MAFF 240422]TDZ34501.1 hypothetical protein C8035_v010582 [Colletotrichum spinosum]
MATKTDYQIASLAAGFTIGFGFLTVWEAMKQTKRNRNPLRSSYVYMMWGEILANMIITIIGWLFLDGVLGPTVPVLFVILLLWVFEIQLLMQIIINRIAVIAESQRTILWLKWGTAVVITMINIAVFCVWIPAHLVPPVNDTFVHINHYWDRISKVLILLVDAGLNYYFLRVVQKRLLAQHGLVKYKPLVGFNAKLMILSIAMDAMLIGLMSLPNQVVYIQFHPVAYMVKLNIEMSMASLITRLARDKDSGFRFNSLSYSSPQSNGPRTGHNNNHNATDAHRGDLETGLKSYHRASVGAAPPDLEDAGRINHPAGIHRRVDVEVRIDRSPKTSHAPSFGARSRDDAGSGSTTFYRVDDEDSLTSNPGHPRPMEKKD